jgi:hypothetical protein
VWPNGDPSVRRTVLRAHRSGPPGDVTDATEGRYCDGYDTRVCAPDGARSWTSAWPSPSAGSLHNQSGALTAIEEAVQIRRDLAAKHPYFVESLARSLTSRRVRHTELGDFDGAL